MYSLQMLQNYILASHTCLEIKFHTYEWFDEKKEKHMIIGTSEKSLRDFMFIFIGGG